MVDAYSTLAFSMEMDGALVWVTAKIMGYRPRWRRVGLAALLGTLPTLWVLLQHNIFATPWPVELLWPAMMVWLGMGRLPRRLWIKTYLLFWALTIFAGGLVSLGLTWIPASMPYLDWALVIPPLLAFIGARAPHRTVRHYLGQQSHGEITVYSEGRALTVRTLWDSGNQLRDPVLNRPVVVMETQAAIEWLSPEVLRWVTDVARGELAPVPDGWQGQLGTVRYHSLGGDGVMPVLSIDRAVGYFMGREFPMVPVVVGFTSTPVAHDQSYVALAAPSSLVSQAQEGVGA